MQGLPNKMGGTLLFAYAGQSSVYFEEKTLQSNNYSELS